MHAPAQPIAAAFGYHDYLDAVAHLPPLASRPLSLRLHIPAFGADGATEDAAGAALANYLAYLKREAAMHAVLFMGMSTVRQLGFDGAFPSCLADRQLASLLGHLHEHFRFMPDEAGDYEVAVAPAGLPGGRLAGLRRLGFNRLRFDLDPASDGLEGLGGQLAAARAAGFRSVGVALPYGAPGQGFGPLRRMLELVVAAAPDQIWLCHRPGDRIDDTLDEAPAGALTMLPPGGVAQRMQQLCCDRLDMAGYTALGLEHFARLPGDTQEGKRHGGQAHLPGTHLIGCGAGAASTLDGLCWHNAAALDDYYARLNRNEVPVAHGRRHSGNWQTRPYLMQVKDFPDADQ